MNRTAQLSLTVRQSTANLGETPPLPPQEPMVTDSSSRGSGEGNFRKSGKGNREFSTKSKKLRKSSHIQNDEQQALELINQGRLQEAEAIYRRLIQQGARSHLVFGNLGAICAMEGRTQEATTFLKEAVAINPHDPEILFNLGVSLLNQGELQAAIDAYRKAIALKPNSPKALFNLGNALKEQGHLEAAIDAYQKAIATKPDYIKALFNLGNTLKEQGNLDAAIVSYRQALDLKPGFPEALNSLGLALGEQGNPEAAIVSYRQALDLKPDYPGALNNLGIALVDQGDLEAAIASHRKAVSLDHKNPDYHYNLSYVLLLSGDYDNGWEEYEWRFKKKHVALLHAHPPAPQWNGHNHSPGETLMLVSEQSLGDILQFMRYVPYLKTFGPGMDVAFCAQPKLHGLILSSEISTRVHTPEEANAFTFGKWLPLLSLPKHLKVSPTQPLVQVPYIKAPAEKVHHWQERLATEKRPIIGIHWQGNRQSERTRDNSQRLVPLWRSRSLPLEAFAPISDNTSATFLSLQKGPGAEQLDHCPFRHRFVACQDHINGIWDFVETAAMIANCDLIITNDTALAHLAGGMGHPTWLLLNKCSEWRWGMEGDSTFWYGSMRLFRQREWGNWAEVMDRVVGALKTLPTRKAESIVPAKTASLATSLKSGKAEGINHAQHEDEQRALALIGRGQLQEAEAIYRKLIQQGVRSHLVFGNLGAIYAMEGRAQEATTFLKEALAIKPDFPDALANLGYALHQQGNLNAAIDAYRKALIFKPNNYNALTNLGSALQKQGNLNAAINAYRKALAIEPNAPNTLNNLGSALGKQGDLQAAIDSYQKALALNPNYPEALSNLGNVLKEQGHLGAAIDACQKALAIKPDFPDALSNLGNAFKEQGHLEAAIDAYRKALAIKPDFPDALSNLAIVLKEQSQLETAVELYRKAISLDPDHALGHFNLSHALLLSGDYDNGWKEYRWRFAAKKISPHACPKVQQWNGSNHTPGEQLIVISEQGLGDTLQFMRYIPCLKTMGLQVCFCAQTNLHGLIQASGMTTRLCEPEEANALTTGKWVPLLSLPAYLNVRPHNPLIDTPYIKAPGQQVLHWKQKLTAEHGPIIGLNWQGNPRAENGHLAGRSLPLEAFTPITQVTEVSFLSLQKGYGSEQLMDCPFRHRFVGCQEDINETWDFVETAAIMANCDLIITVDTVVAHLAAGLGRPTWLLLKKVPDWRWGMEGDTTFWYGSMRLFRQRERGNWADVMDRVARALESLPTKEAKCLVPAKMTSLAPGKAEGINHAQHEDEQRALVFINQGQLQEAGAIYRRLIQQGSGSHIVFGNLGVICAMQGRSQEATTFLREAVAIKPDFPDALSNLSQVLREQGQLDAAVDAGQKAIAIQPNHPGILSNLGIALSEQGQFGAAIDAYRKALAIKPDFLEVLNNLGTVLKEQGQLDAAIDAYRKALTIKPDYPDALSNLAIVFWEQGDLQAAIDSCRKALAIKPDFPDALINLGIALRSQGLQDAAIDAYHKALAIKPDHPDALFNLGNALKDQEGHFVDAIDAYHKALAIKPDHCKALSNLASILREQGDLQAAIALNKEAVSLQNSDPDHRYNLSYSLLLSGDYENGWEEYEWRFKKKDVAPPHAHPPVPQWNGHDLSPGETLMLVSEQGIGDTLQFMRYVPYLNTLGLGMDVAFCAQPKLHGLILSSWISTRVYTPEEANAFTSGKWLPLLSLPKHLKVSPTQPLVQTPYIKAPAEKVRHWQEKLAAEKRPIIGIHWHGNRQSERISVRSRQLTPLWRSRSLPLEAFAPISEATSATFLSLQKGDGAEQLDHCSFRHRFVACQEDINGIWDFVETAAMIANCDLVITNDTALAHLAGGMGQSTWLLLNKGGEWRWGMDGDSTFWYGSMRLFRQREWGNWAEVMDRVAGALKALPTKEAEPLAPEKTTLLTTSLKSGKAGGLNNAQHEDEQQALALINQGRLQEAEAIYRNPNFG